MVVESLILLGIGHFLGYLGWLELGLLKVNPLKTVFSFLFQDHQVCEMLLCFRCCIIS